VVLYTNLENGQEPLTKVDLTTATMTITRREFIGRVAQAGGYGAAFMTMHSLGLLGMVESEQQKDFPLPPSSGRGTKVIILGAGIAGPRLRLRDAPGRLRLHCAGGARASRRAQLDPAQRIESWSSTMAHRKSAPSMKATTSTVALRGFLPSTEIFSATATSWGSSSRSRSIPRATRCCRMTTSSAASPSGRASDQ
jgi:hypothetical protein